MLGFLFVAGSAHAQFEECVGPADVPDAVLETIFDQASFDFGDVSDKTCSAIVKEGIKACKAQVKGAQKCFDRAYDGNYKIGLKQCQELEDPEDRGLCKSEFKAIRDDGKSDIAFSTGIGLGMCDDVFADALSDACLGTVLK